MKLRPKRKETAGDTAADVYPTDPTAGDHGLHVSDEDCARCGRAIGPNDEARRTLSGDCVHLNC